MPDAVCLIINPTAGGGRAGRAARGVEAALRAHGLHVRSERSRDLDHARALAAQAATSGEITIVLGGDGLAGAVADVLRSTPGSVMGVLPGGRGNDLVRVLGLPNDPVAAARAIAPGTVRALDLGEVGGRAYLGIASAGFDSDANRIANEAPPRLGNLVYAYGALRALASWRPARFELTLHDDTAPGAPTGAPSKWSYTGYSVAVANSKAYGGGMFLAPDAELDDGLLDVVTIKQLAKLRYLANLPKVFKGTHVELPWVDVARASLVEISADRPFALYADGEEIAQLPVTIRVLPGAVRMLVPPDASSGPGS